MEHSDLGFIHKYFIAEKQESLLFLLIGTAAILLALVFFFFIKTDPSFFKGMVIPLAAIGIIQCVVGYTVYARSDKQRMDIAYQVGIEPWGYTRNTELPRMETVMKNFLIYRWVEISFIITGIAMVSLFRSNPDKTYWYGFGLALAIQAAIMLGADHFAEKRGGIYVKELRKLMAK